MDPGSRRWTWAPLQKSHSHFCAGQSEQVKVSIGFGCDLGGGCNPGLKPWIHPSSHVCTECRTSHYLAPQTIKTPLSLQPGSHWMHHSASLCESVGSFSNTLRGHKAYTYHVAFRCNSPILEEPGDSCVFFAWSFRTNRDAPGVKRASHHYALKCTMALSFGVLFARKVGTPPPL